MKRIIKILFIILTQSIFVHGQNVDWAKQVPTSSDLDPKIAVDSKGNSYLCGAYKDTCIFGIDTIISQNPETMFFAKYDSSGAIQWAQTASGTSPSNASNAQDICLDAYGNIYLTGQYNGTTDFGGIILLGSGSYVAKYTSSGSIIWAHRIDTLQSTYSTKIIAGDSNSIFIAGNFWQQTDIGCSILNPVAASETQFIIRYDSSGTCQWGKTFIATYLFDMAIDKDNNIYVTGAFMGNGTFDTIIISNHGSQDIYLAKCNSNGTWDWALSFGSNDYDQGLGVTTDKYGHIFLTGYFSNSADFIDTTLVSTGAGDIFIACFDKVGNIHWVRQAGGGYGNQYSFAITSNNFGNCIITGSIIDTTHFGNHTVIPNGEKTFIAKYDSTGYCTWAFASTGDSGDRGYDIKTDTLDNIYLSGFFYWHGTYSFGSFTFNVTSDPTCSFGECPTIYLVKINSSIAGVETFNCNQNNVLVYPNPFTSEISINIIKENWRHASYSIYNVFGQSICFNNDIKQEKIDLTFLPSGIYFLELNIDEGKTVTKILKQ